jgi:hypothetical protein
MAQYRLLSDFYNNGAYFNAGDVITLPDNFVPSAVFEPLDSAAVTAFYAAGPQPGPLVRAQWVNNPVSMPATYWRQIPGGRFWRLTGLGAGLAPIGA